ncbi:MAG: D-alanine--D-alanine ligase family protein [Proteocatella sp.]
MRIGILFGGKSEEHEVSCISAHSINKNIDKEKFEVYLIGITKKGKFKHFTGNTQMLLDCTWEKGIDNSKVEMLGNDGPVGIYADGVSIELDCIFPALHGPFGEDGRIQGILDYSGIPYVGCGVLSSALCMDKSHTKELLSKKDINQAKYIIVRRNYDMQKVYEGVSGFKYPLFVKPSNMGSSVGITKVKNQDELKSAMEKALEYDNKILIEEGVDARELEVAVIGNGQETQISTPGEIVVNDDFYDYDTKYKKGTSELFIPAEITKEQEYIIKNTAKLAYEALDCSGLARVDFFIDRNDGKVILNEINTMPGFTKISMYPKLLEYDGISYKELITKLIELSFKAE